VRTLLENNELYDHVCGLLKVKKLHGRYLKVLWTPIDSDAMEFHVLPHCILVSAGLLVFYFKTNFHTMLSFDKENGWYISTEASGSEVKLKCDVEILK
jgi:hypothetical protein